MWQADSGCSTSRKTNSKPSTSEEDTDDNDVGDLSGIKELPQIQQHRKYSCNIVICFFFLNSEILSNINKFSLMK